MRFPRYIRFKAIPKHIVLTIGFGLSIFLLTLLVVHNRSQIVTNYNVIVSDFTDDSFSISFSTLQPKYFQAVLLAEDNFIQEYFYAPRVTNSEDVREIGRVNDLFKPGYYTHYYKLEGLDPERNYRVAIRDYTGKLWKTDKLVTPDDWKARYHITEDDSDPLPLSGSVSYEGEYVNGAIVYAKYNDIVVSTITAEEGKYVIEAAKFGLSKSDFEKDLSIPIYIDLSYLGGYETELTYNSEEISRRVEKDLGNLWSQRATDWGSHILPKEIVDTPFIFDTYAACPSGQSLLCQADTSRGKYCNPGVKECDDLIALGTVDPSGYPMICDCHTPGGTGSPGEGSTIPDLDNPGWENGVPEVGGSTPLDSQICEYECSVGCSNEHADGNWYGQCGNPDKQDAGVDTCACIKLEGDMQDYTIPDYDPDLFGSGQGGFTCPPGQEVYVAKLSNLFCVPADAPKVGMKVDPALVQTFQTVKDTIDALGISPELIVQASGAGSFGQDASGRPIMYVNFFHPDFAIVAAHEAIHNAGYNESGCWDTVGLQYKEFCAEYCSWNTSDAVGYMFEDDDGVWKSAYEIAANDWYGGETDYDKIKQTAKYQSDCIDPNGMCRGGICEMANQYPIDTLTGKATGNAMNRPNSVLGLENYSSGIPRNWDFIGDGDLPDTPTPVPSDQVNPIYTAGPEVTGACSEQEAGQIVHELKSAFYYYVYTNFPTGTEITTSQMIEWLEEKITSLYINDINKVACILLYIQNNPSMLHFDPIMVWDEQNDGVVVTTGSTGFADFAHVIDGLTSIPNGDNGEYNTLPASEGIDASGLYEIYSAFPLDYDSETGSFLVGYDEEIASQSSSLIQRAYANEPTIQQIDPANAKLFLFGDSNGNGKYDEEGEQIEQLAGIPIIIKRAEAPTEHVYELEQGLNMVAFPFETEQFTARTLLDKINSQGGNVTEISTIRNGSWQTYKKSNFTDYTYKDYPIELGKGYFIFSEANSTLHLWGTKVDFTYEIPDGYLSVGFSETLVAHYESAYGLLEQDLEIDQITRFEDGRFYSVIRLNDELFGHDYALNEYEGYFIRKLRAE